MSDQTLLVPKEPTGEMQAVGRDAIEPYVQHGLSKAVNDQWQIAREVYAAMLAAAPLHAPPLSGKNSIEWLLICARLWVQNHIDEADAEATQDGLPELLALIVEIEEKRKV